MGFLFLSLKQPVDSFVILTNCLNSYGIQLYNCLDQLLTLGGLLLTQAQTRQPTQSLSEVFEREGEVFVAVDKYYENLERTCTVEDLFNNRLSFRDGVITIHFTNHTESVCERTFLKTEIDFIVSLRDLNAGHPRLVQKKYNLGKGRLSDGQDQWYEVYLFTRQDQLLIRRKEASGEEETLSTARMLFKSQEGTKQALAILKRMLAETQAR